MFNLSGVCMPSLKNNFILFCLHLLFLSLHSKRFHGIGEQRKQRNRIFSVLVLAPFFAQLKHCKSHSPVFLCSPMTIPWKWLPCRLDVAARALFQAKDHDVIHRMGGVVEIFSYRKPTRFRFRKLQRCSLKCSTCSLLPVSLMYAILQQQQEMRIPTNYFFLRFTL